MTSEWIKIEKKTPRKPEVLRIGVALNVASDHAFGLCVRFWMWCDDHMATANAHGVTEEIVDKAVDHAGFAQAALLVGWLRVRNGSLEVPNFDRHLSESAKKRALTAQRVANHKAGKANAEVTRGALPEKEKKRSIQIENSQEGENGESQSRPQPVDTSQVDWDEAYERVQEILREIPAANPQELLAAWRLAVLTCLDVHWSVVRSGMNATRARQPEPKAPMGFLVKCVQRLLAEKGLKFDMRTIPVAKELIAKTPLDPTRRLKRI